MLCFGNSQHLNLLPVDIWGILFRLGHWKRGRQGLPCSLPSCVWTRAHAERGHMPGNLPARCTAGFSVWEAGTGSFRPEGSLSRSVPAGTAHAACLGLGCAAGPHLTAAGPPRLVLLGRLPSLLRSYFWVWLSWFPEVSELHTGLVVRPLFAHVSSWSVL